MGDLSLTPNQVNLISFVLVDSSGNEVTGLGGTFDVNISKNGAVAVAGTGSKAEVSGLVGWYTYQLTALECDTPGLLLIQVDAGGATIYQNLEYVILDRRIFAIDFTYTVTDNSTSLPIEGVQCWFSTDSPPTNVIWYGVTDAFGVARDANGNLPRLDVGTYYISCQKAGYTFDIDTEVVS